MAAQAVISSTEDFLTISETIFCFWFDFRETGRKQKILPRLRRTGF